jgi:hypothetical protein
MGPAVAVVVMVYTGCSLEAVMLLQVLAHSILHHLCQTKQYIHRELRRKGDTCLHRNSVGNLDPNLLQDSDPEYHHHIWI